MNKLGALFLVILISSSAWSQSVETKYYSNRSLSKEVLQTKAKFSRTVTKGSDGRVTTSLKDIKNNQIIYSETFKGNEPFGVWIVRGGELDYEFPLVYGEDQCANGNELEKLETYFEDNDSIGYKAPEIGNEASSIWEIIGKNITYPSYSRRRGIEGRVYIYFIINEDGSAENFVVVKGVETNIDKEALRVVRKIKFSNPPMHNGVPVKVCVILPITFRLA